MRDYIYSDEEEDEPDEKEGLKDILNINKFDNKFLESRKVFLWGPVHDQSAEKIVNRLLFLEAKEPGNPINFYINTPGGVVTSGMIIYDVMQMITSPVHTHCMGLAASMGSILLAGGEMGERYIWPNGRVMIHQPSIGGFQATASDIEIQAKEILKTRDKLAQILAERCNKTIEELKEDFDRDFWLDADAALEYGIVDKIADKL